MTAPTFVLCIEANAICAQALLLCESIRAFGGAHRDAPIVAVAPRAGLGIDARTRRALERLRVDYVEAPLNQACPEYGSANRVFAAAWVETTAQTDWIVVLDSDTVVLDELTWPDDADVAVRPVDSKGSATTGPGDPFEPYWRRMADLAGMDLDRLPFVPTTDGLHRVRASYNGGLVVARRHAGLLGAWAELFARSVAAGLKPWAGRGLNVVASTGRVGRAASEYWGSNQTALALTVWRAPAHVHVLPPTCNLPLQLLADRPALVPAPPAGPPVHVHYHGLFTDPGYRPALALLRELGTPRELLEWLKDRLPIF